MSANVYRCSRTIHFSDSPTTKFGWLISTTGDAKSVEQFKSQLDQDNFVRIVARRFPDMAAHEVEHLAAFITFFEGSSESEWVEFALGARLTDYVDQFDDWLELLNGSKSTAVPEHRITGPESSSYAKAGIIVSQIEGFSKTESLWDASEEFDNDDLADKQDTIFRNVFGLMRDNLPELNQVCETLDRISRVVECTFAHDPETGERTDGEPGHSAADVFEMVCNLDEPVQAARKTMSELFRTCETADNNATA